MLVEGAMVREKDNYKEVEIKDVGGGMDEG